MAEKDKVFDEMIIKVEALVAWGVEIGAFTLNEMGTFMQEFMCPHCRLQKECPLQDCYIALKDGAGREELKAKMVEIAEKNGWPLKDILREDTPAFLKIPKKG